MRRHVRGSGRAGRSGRAGGAAREMRKKQFTIIGLLILVSLYILGLYLYFSYYLYNKRTNILFVFIISLIINLLVAFLIKKPLPLTLFFVVGVNLIYTGIIVTVFARGLLFSSGHFFGLLKTLKTIAFYFICLSINGNFLIPFIAYCLRLIVKPRN
jgi:hypothetical protein